MLLEGRNVAVAVIELFNWLLWVRKGVSGRSNHTKHSLDFFVLACELVWLIHGHQGSPLLDRHPAVG